MSNTIEIYRELGLRLSALKAKTSDNHKAIFELICDGDEYRNESNRTQRSLKDLKRVESFDELLPYRDYTCGYNSDVNEYGFGSWLKLIFKEDLAKNENRIDQSSDQCAFEFILPSRLKKLDDYTVIEYKTPVLLDIENGKELSLVEMAKFVSVDCLQEIEQFLLTVLHEVLHDVGLSKNLYATKVEKFVFDDSEYDD